MQIFLEGFILGMSLIAAIGPQNAFVLKNGIRKKFVLITPLITSLCDVILILLGVFGCGQVLSNNPMLKMGLISLGIIFLSLYALKCALNIFKEESLKITGGSNANDLKKVFLYCLGISFLNPHAILDTLIIIGSVATTYTAHEAVNFSLGLILSSFVWFFSISIFASLFSKFLAKPLVWKFIDLSISIVCFKVAYDLATLLISLI